MNMTLIITISLTIAIISFVKGNILIGVLCILGPFKNGGMFALIAASILLIINKSYIMGTTIILLILWNIIGTKILFKQN